MQFASAGKNDIRYHTH